MGMLKIKATVTYMYIFKSEPYFFECLTPVSHLLVCPQNSGSHNGTMRPPHTLPQKNPHFVVGSPVSCGSPSEVFCRAQSQGLMGEVCPPYVTLP